MNRPTPSITDLRIQAQVAKTIVFVTHDIDEALLSADRVLLLGASGRIESEVPGLRHLPASARRAALAAPDGAAQRAALYAALRESAGEDGGGDA